MGTEMRRKKTKNKDILLTLLEAERNLVHRSVGTLLAIN